MIAESAMTDAQLVFGQGINHNSPQGPDTSSPLFAHMIVGKVIFNMKELHDCRTSPVSIAQRSFSRSLQEACQGLRLGLGFASLPQSEHRQNRATSKLYSKIVAKLAPHPCSNSALSWQPSHYKEQAGSHT